MNYILIMTIIILIIVSYTSYFIYDTLTRVKKTSDKIDKVYDKVNAKFKIESTEHFIKVSRD